MNNPVKQHTVPNSYLLRFADKNGFTWVYDRVEHELRSQPTLHSLIEKDFYTIDTKDGEKIYNVESKILAANIEAKADLVISKIERDEDLTNEEYHDLCSFVTFQWLRTTAARRDFNSVMEQFSKFWIKLNFGDPKIAEKSINRYETKTGEKLGSTPDEMSEFAKTNYSIKVPKEYHIQQMLTSYQELFKELFSLNWLFVKAPENEYFITSDNPFFVFRPGARPLMPYHISWAEITMPLTPKICLYMNGSGNRVSSLVATAKEVKNFNCRTIYSSDRFIISRKRKYLESLIKESKIDLVSRKPSMKLDTPLD